MLNGIANSIDPGQTAPQETICMKYQNTFSDKNKKTIISLSSAELAQRVKMLNLFFIITRFCRAEEWTVTVPPVILLYGQTLEL